MSTEITTTDLLNVIARACRPANVVELPRRKPEPSERTYHAILVRDDVSMGELAHALRFSGIVLTTHAASGAQIIHRPTPPKDAA